MQVNFCSFDEFNELKPIIENIYQTALLQTGKPSNVCITIALMSPEEIHEYNKKYRGVDRTTDVLSFPFIENIDEIENEPDYFTGVCEIGDIYINPIKAKEQAKEYGHSTKREVCFLALHGLLHLLGYDHMNESEEKVMFDLQNKILEIAEIGRD